MQQPNWFEHLMQRADIGKSARDLKPIASDETVIGRLPRRLRTLFAAYTLQTARVRRTLLALDEQYDYAAASSGVQPIDNPMLEHERNKMELMHMVFWLTVLDELNLSGNLGLRQHWQIVRLP